jgi:predicted transposase YdaD
MSFALGYFSYSLFRTWVNRIYFNILIHEPFWKKKSMQKRKGHTHSQGTNEFHPWDRRMKWLFSVAPEDMGAWISGNNVEFLSLANTDLDSQQMTSDMLCYVLAKGHRALLHIEFQKRRDSAMAKRLWEYNVRATMKYDCPVWSCVIYLTKESTPQQPYYWFFPTGRLIHHFSFDVLKMWEIPTRDLLALGRRGLLPLLPLTREGRQPEVIEQAIDLLMPEGEEPCRDLLSLVYGFASLVFERNDQEWLRRRFAMLYDILRDSPAFQDIAREGFEQGIQQGRTDELKRLRQLAADLVATRFADASLTASTLHTLDGIDDAQRLHLLIINLMAVQTPEAARHLLTE